MRAFTLCLLCMLLFLRSHCPAAMLLLGLVPLAPSHAASVTVPVGGSIQAAIDAASPGDAIHLGRGEYFENIRLKQGVALVGSGPQATTIRALLRGCVVLADGDNELRHLAIADGDPGVYASNGGDFIASDCCFIGNTSTALVLTGPVTGQSNSRVERCLFTGNGIAISVDDCTGAEIRDCDIHGNYGGIYCIGPASATITECEISCNVWGLDVCNVFPECGVLVVNCVLRANGSAVRSYATRNPILVNCTLWGNIFGIRSYGDWPAHIAVSNSVIWDTEEAVGDIRFGSSVEISYSAVEAGWPGEGNIDADPQFADPLTLNFRLRPGSPCMDAGDNDAPGLPETDIAGTHRIMYGGKSFTVDMGAYEYYINRLDPVPGTHETIFTWSSIADKTYSIFYSPDLLTWHIAIDNFPSAGNQTTSWTDDGSKTGIAPTLAPRRFYRVLENR